MTADEKLKRTWDEIAREVCAETDSEKLMTLAEELLKALDEQVPQKAKIGVR